MDTRRVIGTGYREPAANPRSDAPFPGGSALRKLTPDEQAEVEAFVAHCRTAINLTDQDAAVETAVHALCHMDAGVTERLEAAEVLSKAFGRPWPPYPDAVDDEESGQ